MLASYHSLDWLHHRGQFTVPGEVSERKEKSNGGLRLLICDRTSLFPPGFGMPKAAFIEAEQVLNLHKATLPSYLVANGTHSRYLTKDEDGNLLKIGWFTQASVPILADRCRFGTKGPSEIRSKLEAPWDRYRY
jgi:hypothetical protein